MSVHLRHPGSVPALFSREIEPHPPRGRVGILRRALAFRSRRLGSADLSIADPTFRWLALSLVLLAAEAPILRAAETLMTLAVSD